MKSHFVMYRERPLFIPGISLRIPREWENVSMFQSLDTVSKITTNELKYYFYVCLII